MATAGSGTKVKEQSVDIPASNKESFGWERPTILDHLSLTAAASVQHARAMKETVRARDRQIRLLRKELVRVNEENFRLLKELDGYRGLKRQQLYEENKMLREHVKRVTKENLMLRGQQRMKLNTRVQPQ